MKRIPFIFRCLGWVGFAFLLLGVNLNVMGQWTEPVPMEPHFGNAVKAPWISNDGLRLYVSGTGYLFVTRRDSVGAPWQPLQTVGDHINSGLRQESPCESPNGDTLYFMSWERADAPSFGYYDIYFCVRTDSGWGPVQNCGENINSFDFEWSVGISRDGQLLLVSSDRWPSSGRDLLYSERQLDGAWGQLVSFGAANNWFDDNKASLSPDNCTLYISGDGPGRGNLLVSQRVGGLWQESIEIPPPVNSVTNQEQDPCIASDGRTLWFARDDDDINGYRIYTSVDTTVLAITVPPFQNLSYSLTTYPNPFNSTLSISLAIPPHQETMIALYDLLGREVDVIYRGRLANSTISYRAPAGLASGIYFVRATGEGTGAVMRKVVLLK